MFYIYVRSLFATHRECSLNHLCVFHVLNQRSVSFISWHLALRLRRKYPHDDTYLTMQDGQEVLALRMGDKDPLDDIYDATMRDGQLVLVLRKDAHVE